MNNFKFLLPHQNQKSHLKKQKKIHYHLQVLRQLCLLLLKEKQRKKNDLLINNYFLVIVFTMEVRMPGGNGHLKDDLRLD